MCNMFESIPSIHETYISQNNNNNYIFNWNMTNRLEKMYISWEAI